MFSVSMKFSKGESINPGLEGSQKKKNLEASQPLIQRKSRRTKGNSPFLKEQSSLTVAWNSEKGQEKKFREKEETIRE